MPYGVFDHKPPEDQPGMKYVGVGSSRAAKYGGEITKLQNELGDFLSSLNPLG